MFAHSVMNKTTNISNLNSNARHRLQREHKANLKPKLAKKSEVNLSRDFAWMIPQMILHFELNMD